MKMNVSLEGFNSKTATFAADAGVKKGEPVTFTSNYTVGAAGSGVAFCGICVDVRDGYATVQLCGYCKVKYSGAAPTVGRSLLAGDGSSNVKTMSSNGTAVSVIDVAPTGKTVGFYF